MEVVDDRSDTHNQQLFTLTMNGTKWIFSSLDLWFMTVEMFLFLKSYVSEQLTKHHIKITVIIQALHNRSL